jgi:choline dehydrogenase-like flavoprotein
MLIDARRIAEAATVETRVCIIGAGAAGLTIAMELERQGVGAIVLESGGHAPDAATGDLYHGSNEGIPYSFAGGCRSRYLGGSSNCWGGWCRPWDDWDFEQRDWVADSGWPIARAELDPYYERAHRILKLGPNRYDPDYWIAANQPALRRIVLDPDRIVDMVSQFSPPVRFGIDYREQLAAARHVHVYLWSNVVELRTDNPATAVREVLARTLDGRTLRVRAKEFVLATGGIENARILLAANSVQPGGLGNGHDLVGRYFMDHPRLNFGSIRFAPQWRRNMLYDIKFHYQNDAVSARGTRLSAQFALSRTVQRDEGLLNARAWFRSIFPGETSDAARALFRMKRRLAGMDESGHSVPSDLLRILRQPVQAGLFAAARVMHLTSLIRDVRFELIVEPQPDRDSRVTLCRERDALGMPRVRIDWRLGPLVRRTFDRTVQILGDELTRQGIAEVQLPDLLGDGPWPSSLEGTWHHMGTTRMHDSPRHGVVDRNCQVHGMANLYVAGSSVFPTCGANYPTLTLVALAYRLSERLVAAARSPEAVLDREQATRENLAPPAAVAAASIPAALGHAFRTRA